ncbi:UDPGT domain-containing protein [Rhizoctonia solani AG-1 IA]|uniref:UDPGT domain-containing protein n=1 Tax=Thanatephorus cucumeris (strain AG1-IA) TaxID=983506 RepID=L8WVP7_THACA|nr:UDPGT domain-containing protein [Rhizoctonia solani AG-1 IA]
MWFLEGATVSTGRLWLTRVSVFQYLLKLIAARIPNVMQRERSARRVYNDLPQLTILDTLLGISSIPNTMNPKQRDSVYSRGSQRYNSYHDLPVPSSAPGSVYYSPNTVNRSFESLAQDTIQPPPPPVYARYDPRSEPGPSVPRSSFHSYSSSQISELEKDLPPLPGYTQLDAKTTVSEDGRLNVSFGNRMSKAFPESYGKPVHEVGIDEAGFRDAPRMNVNIMIVGSRGDVQPYLALGKRLQRYGHQVRLSTHETFRKMVKDAGLRFYNIGGDPHELMSYMVRNPGLIPGIESLKNGDIDITNRNQMQMLEGCFASCFAPDHGSNEEAGFAADAIISNPPTFAHIHCAEALDVVGFYFLDLASDYKPPDDLIEFLKCGEPPVYIGFGSIVLQNPQEMTRAILSGIAQTGVRAIISPGWGGLDEDLIRSAGPHIFALGNVPHDWLFQHVSAVCHHGGAGTTAIGLKCGKPTIIVPFFGDQPWWATQIARRGAGPPPLDSKNLTAAAFAAALRMALSPATLKAAGVVGEMIRQEDGTQNGLDSFHRHMPLLNMRLSAFAAQVLSESGYIDINKLQLHRSREYVTQIEAFDPVSGTLSPAMKILGDFGRGVSKLPTRSYWFGTRPGATNTLKGTADGFTNLPKLYGGQVRETKKVNGIGSGVVEGTKSLLFGAYDGVNDFFREPVRGYKENGILGAAAGVAKGSKFALSVTTKPLAGSLQFVSKPLEGTAKDICSLFRKQVGKERIAARYHSWSGGL